MPTNYDAGSEYQSYGKSAYGSGYESPWESTLGSSGSLTKTLVKPAFNGSITPQSNVTRIIVRNRKEVAGTIGTSGLLKIFLNKSLSGTLEPHKNNQVIYNNFVDNIPLDTTLNLNNDIGFNEYIDGLTKKITTKRSSSIGASGQMRLFRKFKKSLNGSITSSSTVVNAKKYLYKKTIQGEVAPKGNNDAIIEDPNDINVLVRRNSQKVIPKVKAYWASGRFTTQLLGFSSSDQYQEKTKALAPVINWRFDELTTTQKIAQDYSQNNYDAQYIGSCLGVPGALKGPDSNKYAMSLNGYGYVSLANNIDLNLKDNFQIELWLKIPSTPMSTTYVFSKGIGISSVEKQYAMEVDTNKKINIYAYAGANEYKIQSTTVMANNTWYHIVYTVENQKLKLIINGVQEGNAVNIGNDINTTTGPLEVGRLSGIGYNFIGAIDEFTVYNKVVLSANGSAYARYRSGINEGSNSLANRFYPEQLMNGFARVSYVWGVTDTKKLNGDYITANGECYTMEDKDSYRYEHGWWSRSISDSDGKMPFVETVLCEFDQHPATQIDVYTSEFFAGIKEFDLYYKDTSGTWTSIVNGITIGKNDYKINVNLGGSLMYIKGVRIDIKSIWAASDVARVEEIDPTYVTDISDDVISFDVSTERENFDSNIPIGSSNANSLSLQLNNVDLQYSLYNTYSPYYGLILPDVKFEVELGWWGTEYNYQQIGTFWADEWQESSDSMTIDIKCRDYSKFLQDIISTGSIWLDVDGSEAVSNLLKEANFPAYDIVGDLPYDTTALRNSPAVLWMMNDSDINKYALNWTQNSIKQYAGGPLQNGPNDSFTLMFWINSTPYSGEQTIMHFYNSSSDFIHITNPKGLAINIKGNKVFTGVNVADSNWHQVSITWAKASGQTKVYVDSILKYTGTIAAGALLTSKYYLSLGAPQSSKGVVNSTLGTSGNQFIGRLTYILLWDKELTSAEINYRAFRDVLAAEKNLRLAFTGYEGGSDIDTFDMLIKSTVYGQDVLKIYNLQYEINGFMQTKDIGNVSNALGFGALEYAYDDSIFSLEPYNKSLLFNGDKPSSMYFDGVGTSYVQTASSSRVSVAEDIDIFIQLEVPTFTPAALQDLYTQSNTTTNNRSISVAMQTNGAIKFSYSTNGLLYNDVLFSVPLQTKNLYINQKFWLRISHDVNNGYNGNNVIVYISKEDKDAKEITSWQLVEKKTLSGVVSRYLSSAPIVLGSNANNTNKFKGKIYSVVMTSGISSQDIRINLNPDNFLKRTNTVVTDNTFNIWNMNNTIFSAGDGSYLFIPQNDALDVLDGSFACIFWIKPKANETYIVLNKEMPGQTTNKTVAIGLTADGRAILYSKNGNQWDLANYQNYGSLIQSKTGVIKENEWNFVGVSYDSITKKATIYVNGDVVGSGTMSVGFIANAHPWIVGTDGSKNYFAGTGMYMNGLGIYNAELNETKLKALYRAGASYIDHRFPAIWTEEGESLWDTMLAVATGDLGTFYFSHENKFIYTNALNNYNPSYKEFSEPQWVFDDDIDIVSASHSIALQSNKIVIKILSQNIDFNKKQQIWQAPDNTVVYGGKLKTSISETFTESLSYTSKTLTEGTAPIIVPQFLPSGYVKIDNEIIGYERKDDYRLYDLRRGQFDTEPAAHYSSARVRSVRVFNIDYTVKPAIVLDDPFISAVTEDKTVDIDKWRPQTFGALLVVSRNTSGDAYLVQFLQSNDPLNDLHNYLTVSGITLNSSESSEKEEFESAEYGSSIRKYGIKQVDISNRFISSHTAAKRYADYFIKHFWNPVPIIEVAILGNPVVKLGDRVTIASLDRMGISQEDFWIESNQIQYSGGIEQTLTLRKVS